MLLVVLAVLCASQAAQGILNNSNVIVFPSGFSVYPCHQINHREPELDPVNMGLWYGIEIIQHRSGPRPQGNQPTDICPKLNLILVGSSKEVKLVWTERVGEVHYLLTMADPENSGFWLAKERQTGSMLSKGYQQFAGSIQVLEAHPNKMILTFCQSNGTHYSIIMVRNITVPHDTSLARQKLTSFGLPEVSVSETCRPPEPDSAAQSVPTVVAILASVTLLLSGLY